MKALMFFLLVTFLALFVFVPRASAGGGVTTAPVPPIDIPQPCDDCGCDGA